MNKKIIIILIVVLILLIGLFTYQYFATQKNQQASNIQNIDEAVVWKKYVNENYGFEVKYPSDWILTEDHSGKLLDALTDTGPYNSFYITPSKTSPEEMTTDYVSINPNGAMHRELDEDQKISFINIGGARAELQEWDYLPGYKKIKILDEKSNWLKEDNEILVLSSKYNKVIDQILSTFKFTR